MTSSVGAVAVLSCQVEGSMRHNLTWYRAGRAIWARAGRVRVLPDSSLQISGVRSHDAGEYQCVATNAHGDSRISVWLLVPGTVAQNPAGHLLKYLTGASRLCAGPCHLFSIIDSNHLAVCLSHFFVRKISLITYNGCLF